ncbi:sugar phosphate nucleotidyltransferase [Bacillus cereus]|uniref:sugar phosphate nucleotidyltransferase n=1 Tax=Bacillus cereus TaxID=1396 RepID=UPI00366F7833
MLQGGEKLYAYPFQGYWKDVGTLQSLWEANMDLLGTSPKLDLNDHKWKISYIKYQDHTHYIWKGDTMSNRVIEEG